jgi:hypothetical protein
MGSAAFEAAESFATASGVTRRISSYTNWL